MFVQTIGDVVVVETCAIKLVENCDCLHFNYKMIINQNRCYTRFYQYHERTPGFLDVLFGCDVAQMWRS